MTTSCDPTAIPIDLDPAKERMRGVTVHSHLSFDVPFISQINDRLWIGGCQDGLVLPSNIEHLVSVYPWEEYTVNHELHSSLTVRMIDGDVVDEELVRSVALAINECRRDGTTLVHCQAGLNRSALVTALALMTGDGMGAAEAIALLRAKRSPAVLCNRTFERWLLDQHPEIERIDGTDDRRFVSATVKRRIDE
jgi:protein-tyrosine phosphatase